MTTIVTRAGKGSPLTHTEVDTNFTNLNTAKLETAAIPLGTLQAPSVSFLNDSDTGIFCPQGGNSLAIVTGGQYAITCTSTQAVGIKTPNPQGALQVAGSTRIGANDATDAFLEIGEGATGNRNSYIDIVADTTYTDYGLRIIRNNTGANATSELKHRGTGALNFTTQEAAPIVFNTTNSPALTILAGGNVGIGSSLPSANLEVKTTSDTGIALTNSSSVTSGNRGSIYQLNSANSTCGLFRFAAVTDNVGTEIQFHTRPAAGSLTQSMTLDSSGRLGIGTTSPAASLDVSGGSIKLRNASSGTNYGYEVDVLHQSGVSQKMLSARYMIAGASGSYTDIAGINAEIENAGYNVYGMSFRTGGSLTERVRIDGSGRLLVGTSSYTGNSAFVIKGGAAQNVGIVDVRYGTTRPTSVDVQVSEIRFGSTDFTSNTSYANIQCVTDGASSSDADIPGRLVFSTTADGASSPTERMRIKANGELWSNISFVIGKAGSFTNYGGYLSYDAGADRLIVVNNSGGGSAGVGLAPGATAWSTYSDERLKTDLVSIDNGLEKVCSLRAVTGRYNTDPEGASRSFLIAQDVQAVLPEAVSAAADEDAFLDLRYTEVIPLLVAALKESKERIEQLEQRLTAAGIA